MRWTVAIRFAGSNAARWLFTTNGFDLTAGNRTYKPGIRKMTPWATVLCNVGQPPKAAVLIEDPADAVRTSIENIPPENARIACGVTFLVAGAWLAPQSVVAGVIADAVTKEAGLARCVEISIAARVFATASNPRYLTDSAVSGDALKKQDLQSNTKWTG